MRIRALSLAFAAAALVGASQTALAQPGYSYRYYYGWRDCWTTMSGLGVCATRPYVPLPAAPSRHRRIGGVQPTGFPRA
jgi:hypothetical protein